jgi:hypothetical protein
MVKLKVLIPEVGKYYKAKIKGYPVVLKYEGKYKPNHCATCTCVSDSTTWVLVESPPGVGAGINDIVDLEEIDYTGV